VAVYTDVSAEELADFIAGYDIGALRSVKGIAEGVENSNYLIQTEAGNYILTLYERRVAEADLPFFLGLMDHLAARGIPCPVPVRDRRGEALGRLCGRPAAIITFLDGVIAREPGPQHCAALGRAMARLHEAGADFTLTRANALSIDGWQTLAATCAPKADQVQAGLAEIITEELADLKSLWPEGLPAGIIHADLFPDNVFFLGDALTGLIDFYFSCNDYLAYDLAVCLNAWCFDGRHRFSPAHARALIAGYQEVRALTAGERAALPVLARGAALRFLLTRLYDKLHHVDGALVRPKDPLEYLARLTFHRTVEDAGVYGLEDGGNG